MKSLLKIAALMLVVSIGGNVIAAESSSTNPLNEPAKPGMFARAWASWRKKEVAPVSSENARHGEQQAPVEQPRVGTEKAGTKAEAKTSRWNKGTAYAKQAAGKVKNGTSTVYTNAVESTARFVKHVVVPATVVGGAVYAYTSPKGAVRELATKGYGAVKSALNYAMTNKAVTAAVATTALASDRILRVKPNAEKAKNAAAAQALVNKPTPAVVSTPAVTKPVTEWTNAAQVRFTRAQDGIEVEGQIFALGNVEFADVVAVYRSTKNNNRFAVEVKGLLNAPIFG